MTSDNLNSDFWNKKWQDGDIGFHQSRYHPMLVDFSDQFLPGAILVPLCGKSLDMLYLSSKGHSIVGVELSPIACRRFFEENGIKFSESTDGAFLVFKSESITLWCGNFFELPQKVWDQVSGIYDRAALVALSVEQRQKYAAEIERRSQTGMRILLISYEYPEGSLSGPPFSVTENEIVGLYRKFRVQKIHSKPEQKLVKDNPRFQSVNLVETVYWLK